MMIPHPGKTEQSAELTVTVTRRNTLLASQLDEENFHSTLSAEEAVRNNVAPDIVIIFLKSSENLVIMTQLTFLQR